MAVDLPLTLRYRGRLIPATALNLSCGGMLLDTEALEVDPTAPVELIFDLSTVDRDIAVRGAVVRCETLDRTTRVGIQFTNLFTVGHDAITRYLRRRNVQ